MWIPQFTSKNHGVAILIVQQSIFRYMCIYTYVHTHVYMSIYSYFGCNHGCFVKSWETPSICDWSSSCPARTGAQNGAMVVVQNGHPRCPAKEDRGNFWDLLPSPMSLPFGSFHSRATPSHHLFIAGIFHDRTIQRAGGTPTVSRSSTATSSDLVAATVKRKSCRGVSAWSWCRISIIHSNPMYLIYTIKCIYIYIYLQICL